MGTEIVIHFDGDLPGFAAGTAPRIEVRSVSWNEIVCEALLGSGVANAIIEAIGDVQGSDPLKDINPYEAIERG